MAFIRKVKTASGAIAIQVAYKSYGKITRLVHIGSAHTEKDIQVLLGLARQQLTGAQQSLFIKPNNTTKSAFKIELKQSFSGMLLRILSEQYGRVGLDKLDDKEFAYLCIARITEPTSKMDSLRVLADLGINDIGKDKLYRCLARIVKLDYRNRIANICFKRAVTQGIILVLYDVTTLHFEIQQEDNYRKPGMSKERRLEPQVVVGLLVDQHGFPLGLHSFEGNTAETNTILPVMEQFRTRHNLENITVVADAAMLSAKNLETLSRSGYRYIVGSRLQKIPYDIAEYQKTGALADGQIITTQLEKSRIIYQYKKKRAAMDIRNIQKQVAKAEKVINGKAPARQAKFLSVKSKEKTLNQVLINKAYTLAGIKGYVTNLDLSDEKVIGYYHQLFNVEASFRMAKSDLRARPVFHRKRDSIEAHLTVVFAAMAIARTIENHTGISIKQFIKTLKPIRSGTVVINGREYVAEAEIPPTVRLLLKKLKSGH